MRDKASRSARNVETRKKKARRTAARPPQTRIQGNTAGARKRLRKQAIIRQGKVAAVAV